MALGPGAQLWLESALDELSYPDSWVSGRFPNPDEWRTAALAHLAEVLGPMPAPVPLDPRVVASEERGTYDATLLSFQVDRSYRTEAYLLMPHGSGPFPALAVLHDHGGFYLWGKEKSVRSPYSTNPALVEHVHDAYADRYVADELASRGYAVIVIDQWLWGEKRIPDVPGASDLNVYYREGVQAYNRGCAELQRQITQALMFAGRTFPGQMLHADRRSLDLLLSDPRVDASRVGCIGLSVGGFRSFHLAAMDERIKAAVVAGWMCSLGSYLRQNDHLYYWAHANGLCTPSMSRYLDYPDVASLAFPRPILVMAGRQDGLFPLESVEQAFHKLGRVYGDLGARKNCETRWYDVPHCLNVEMQEYAFGWLDRWFGRALSQKGRGPS